MPERKIQIDTREAQSSYEISISNGQIADAGRWLRNVVGSGTHKAFVVSNPTVFALYRERLLGSLRSTGFEAPSWLMGDGEIHKSFQTAEAAIQAFADAGLSRTDVVVALGGGVVGDLTGFAASVYLRGIAFVQMPTTLLSMIDSSVGGKTGVNSAAGKNQIGTFYQPRGVLIDTDTLKTLPNRELTAGLCEAVKHGVLAGGSLFSETKALLDRTISGKPSDIFSSPVAQDELDALITAQVGFKAMIVRNDERESPERTDSRSRKVLNLGHTLGHALEKLTKYTYFRHGEAVGYGILYAAEMSKKLDFIGADEVNLLYDVVHRTGALPSLHNIDPKAVIQEFRFDKKIVGGSLQMILLDGIGKPRIVDADTIPTNYFLAAFEELQHKTSI